MKKRWILCLLIMTLALLMGCGKSKAAYDDGTYTVTFTTDSSMFHVNEAYDNKGTLTVKDGEMMLHITLPSKKILNLYPGLAADAAKDGAVLLEPTIDTVTYDDGTSEEVFGFDVPVPVIGEEFDLALVGTKGKWYDHKVIVSDPVPVSEEEILVDISMEGGSGRATIESPARAVVRGGVTYVTITWSSPNYDYMVLDGVRYEPINTEGNSVFELPIKDITKPVTVIGDTTAMSKPHEVEYTLTLCQRVSAAESYSYATGFVIDDLGEGYYRILIDNQSILVVPEGGDAPADSKDIIVRQPVKNAYVAASSIPDMIDRLGKLDQVAFSSTTLDDWALPAMKSALEQQKIEYVGKYRAPDYERLVAKDCDLAIESTMLWHTPEVGEKLTALGIPVIVDTSSYESDPLGRLEWIKVYGALFGCMEEANDIFDAQVNAVEKIRSANDDNSKTVAFFYINSNGSVVVRKPGDYVTKMINMAGGEYVIKSMPEDDNALSTMNMQMESFYAEAIDADIIIYNSTVDGEINSIDELVGKSQLLKDFKAVKKGNVWCSGKNMFQESASVAETIEDLNRVIRDMETDNSRLRFFKHLE